MPNNIGAQVDVYTRELDKIIEREPLTTGLNMNQDLLGKFNGNGKIEIPKFAIDGLGNYDRANGFAEGSLSLTWEQKSLRYDRGREFSIDVIDDEERLSVITANAMAEFERTKAVPEVDAVRFATLADKAGTKVSKTFSGATAVEDANDAVLAAEEKMEDKGIALTRCILYCTSAFKTLLRKAEQHRWGNEANPTTNIATFDDMQVVVVPQNRFYDKITLKTGGTGETEGGYVKDATDGKDLNFLVVCPDCCGAIAKHKRLRYFAPEVNQGKDAHLWQYRLYHDLLVYDNKVDMIYCSKKA